VKFPPPTLADAEEFFSAKVGKTVIDEMKRMARSAPKSSQVRIDT
jgi:hypothetical protein